MKGSMLWRVIYIFCALAGCLTGYGVFRLANTEEVKPNTNSKDNTLVQKAEDSVFFDGEKQEPAVLTVTVSPTPERISPTQKPENPAELPIQEPELPIAGKEPEVPEEVMTEEAAWSSGEAVITLPPDTMPSLASQWATAAPEVIPTPLPIATPSAEPPNPVAETFTYPAEIFGQVPVINRSDTYVSYFEFAYDLIAMLEPEVKQRGLNMNSLLTKFAIKAFFCGVDIEKLDINAPIPRRLAALCLWLAAQVLNESGSDTSSKSAQKYVTDISGCSSSEKKAVAYLYEQGILKGFQTPGQKFYPDAGLKTESGSNWLSGIKQCWK